MLKLVFRHDTCFNTLFIGLFVYLMIIEKEISLKLMSSFNPWFYK
jgi:hypothetical protein